MKINIINNNGRYSNLNDVTMLRDKLFRHFKNRVSIEFVNIYDNKIKGADINIFVNIPNYLYLKYAPINILLISLSKFKKTWKYSLNYFDYIITKSITDYNILKQLCEPNRDKIINLNWKAKDNYLNKIDKQQNEWLFMNNDSHTNQFLTKIINIWERNSNFPKLNIINSDPKYVAKSSIKNINNVLQFLKEDELMKFQNKCKYHIHLHSNNSFRYTIDESLSCKGILIGFGQLLNNITNSIDDEKYKNIMDKIIIGKTSKKIGGNNFGSSINIDEKVLENELRQIISYLDTCDDNDLENIQYNNRKYYLKKSSQFNENFRDIFHKIFSDSQSAINNYGNIIKEKELEIDKIYKDLPNVSIITPTYNREYFLKLMIWNYDVSNYPKNKIEWIIVDDSDDVEKSLDNNENFKKILEAHKNIKYIKLDKRHNVGEKRNIGVKHASNDIICMMDDDDYYPYNSIRYRVIELLLSGKKCCGITSHGCFQINKLISLFKINDVNLSLSKRISPASLCFKKDFWNEEYKFNETLTLNSKETNQNTSELTSFIDGREDNFHEVIGSGVLVSLLHNNNYKNNKKNFNISSTPNGCHFGWSDELYLMVTNLDIDMDLC